MIEETLAALQLADSALLNAGLAVTFGATASAACLRRGRSSWARGAAPVLQRALRAALAATLLASLGALWLQAAAMAEVPLAQALPAVGSVLSQSHYGRAWLIGAAGLGVATVAAWWPRRLEPRLRQALVAAGAVTSAYGRSVTGHAGVDGDATWEVAVDVLHLLSVGVWAGQVFVGAFVLSIECSDGDREDRARWVKALSSSATLALAAIVATGTLNAWHAVGSADRLIGTAYGNALIAKVGLIGVAASLGGANRFLLMPRLLRALRRRRAPVGLALRRFRLVLRIESVVLLAVLVVAAVLSATEPPGHGDHGPSPEGLLDVEEPPTGPLAAISVAAGVQPAAAPTAHRLACSRSALATTLADDRLIASAAIIGDSSQPVNG